MSLINKMLQDLDARGMKTGAAVASHVKPVPEREPRIALRTLMIGAALLLTMVLAATAWRFMPRPAGQVFTAPSGPVAVLAPAPVAPVEPVQEVSPAGIGGKSTAPGEDSALVLEMELSLPLRESMKVNKAALDHDNVVGKPLKAEQRPERTSIAVPVVAPSDRPVPMAVPAAPSGGREMTAQQGAEGEYRKALAAMQEGRVVQAMGALEHALQINPRHDAARQTLIGLLLENKRNDEAMRQLQLGLGLDPGQVALAMVLARLQVETGGPALETLMRSLPFASANGEYQAFLAALLQRDQRHAEAAEHYQLALRGAPQNGLWWMGLGISLQADKRLAQAQTAFQRAKAAPNLTPELQAFVDRKLHQMEK